MKTYIACTLIAITLFLWNCHSETKNDASLTAKNESQAHTHHHEHDHEMEHEHDHDHDHSDGHTHDHDHTSDDIHFTHHQAEAVGLQVETVTPSTFQYVIKTSGQILAAKGDEVIITATSNGIVSFPNPSITEGSAIRAGQTIVTLSAKELQEGDPAVKAQIEFETAQKEFQRAELLVKDQIISVRDFEQIRQRYETAKIAYDAQATNMTNKGMKVTSPISGYIKNSMVAQGAYVAVGQPIVTVSQNKRLQLRAEVSESHYKSIKNITGANFRPSYDEEVYNLSELNGRLLSFGKTSGEQSFYLPIVFEFDNRGDILPGAFAEVYLLSSPQENTISIPVEALTEEQGLYYVYLQHGEENYMKQEVAIGQDNGVRVQILSGLVQGDKVVTRGVYQIKLAAISSVMPEGHTHSH